MSSSLFLSAMRIAPFVLFIVAIVIFAGSLISTIAIEGLPAEYAPISQKGFGLVMLFTSLVSAVQNSALTFFGAALLYRVDKWLGIKQ